MLGLTKEQGAVPVPLRRPHSRPCRQPVSRRKGWVLAMLAASGCAWLRSRLRRPCSVSPSASFSGARGRLRGTGT